MGDPELIRAIMLGTTGLSIFPNRRAVKTTHAVMGNFLSSLEGEAWKRVRAIIAPTFSTGKLRSLMPLMAAAAQETLATLAHEAAKPSGTGVNLKDLFGAYTMRVIARSAFGAEPDERFAREASQLFTFPFWRKFLDYVLPMALLDPFGFTVLPKVSGERKS